MSNPRIENWYIELHKGHEYTYYRLLGDIFGHPDFPFIMEGEPCHTSALVSLDLEKREARTKNRIYSLGKCKETTFPKVTPGPPPRRIGG